MPRPSPHPKHGVLPNPLPREMLQQNPLFSVFLTGNFSTRLRTKAGEREDGSVDAAADPPAEPERPSGAPAAKASESMAARHAVGNGASAKPLLFLSHAG